MPRKERKPDACKPWRVGGVTLGYIRNGTYCIDRSIHGKRYRPSTGCRTPDAALAEYRRFEESPSSYVPRSSPGASFQAAVKDYLVYSQLTLQNSAGHVEKQEGYFANLGAFRRGGAQVFSSLDTFTANDIRAYMAWRSGGGVEERKVGKAAVNRDLAALKGLMSWAREEQRTKNKEDIKITLLREDEGQNIPREIPERHWRATLKKLPTLRWQVAFRVLLGSGMRYGELAKTRSADILPHALHVPKSKGRKARTIPVSADTVAGARKLLMLGGVPDDEGGQMNHRLAVATRKAKAKAFSPHELRHTYATACLRNGVPLNELQYRMGHASIRTTEKYLHLVPPHRAIVGAPL